MDLAAMDVRVGNRRNRLPDAVPTLPADLSTDLSACRSNDFPLKKGGAQIHAPLPC
jgi:hypothetical protein